MTPKSTSPTGQAMIEFALMLPIFIIVVLGFFGMAVVFFSFVGASSAAREGAGYVVKDPQTANSAVQTHICTVSPILMSTANCLARSQVVTDPNSCASNNPSIDMCIAIEPGSGRIQGTLVGVTVRYRTPVPTLSLSFLNGPSITFLGPIWLESKSVMRVE